MIPGHSVMQFTFGEIHKLKDLENDIKENKNCYTYLDNLIKVDTTDRVATMETVLATHATISRYGYLDTTVVQRIVAQNWLRRNISNDIKVITYSTIEVIMDENEKSKV